MEHQTHIIDASDKILGRLASEIAILLQGKHKPSYVPYKDMGDFVIVKNIEKIRLTGKKLEKEVYFHHTGYLGGLKKTSLKKIFGSDPGKILKKAVMGMLPKNKLRAKRIKRLKME